MAEKKKIYPNPKFTSFEEEDKYWATHGPLEEGYGVEVQAERQKHSSFLTVRLTGEELTQLRNLAMAKGMGSSTYIRTLIKDALMPREHATLSVKDKAKEQYSAQGETYCILELSKPLISEERMRDIAEALGTEILDQLIPGPCAKIISQGDPGFAEIKRMAKKKAARTM